MCYFSLEVQNHCNKSKWDQSQQIGVRAGEEWVVRFGPSRDYFVCVTKYADHERDDDTGNRPACDVTAGQQDTGTTVAFRNQLSFVKLVFSQLAAHPVVHQPAHETANKNGRRRGNGKINTNGKSQRGDAA